MAEVRVTVCLLHVTDKMQKNKINIRTVVELSYVVEYVFKSYFPTKLKENNLWRTFANNNTMIRMVC